VDERANTADAGGGLGHPVEVLARNWCRLSRVDTNDSMLRTRPHALLTILALAMFLWAQHELQRHTLQHVADQLQRHHQQGLQNPVTDPPCLECSLLAGGSHAIPGNLASLPPDVTPAARIAVSFVSRSVIAASYYSSRAPPSLL
jgi:hypothetical protein